ncbi:hypothetical protein [uncultured Thiothrix sp.]|uniref:hypothetical protein n=1 Tax=uncultured Thiothrix sp. TaxID=223185 RepID=UPI0026270E66|nr:hypothetical protein [uncultured Thiothrix sp.]
MLQLSKAKFLGLCLLPTLLLAGCATTSDPNAPQTEEDKAWAMNVPGQAHTHIVMLPGCSDKPLTFTHVHRPDQNTTDTGAPVKMHLHNGCFQCPPKKAGVKRILH